MRKLRRWPKVQCHQSFIKINEVMKNRVQHSLFWKTLFDRWVSISVMIKTNSKSLNATIHCEWMIKMTEIISSQKRWSVKLFVLKKWNNIPIFYDAKPRIDEAKMRPSRWRTRQASRWSWWNGKLPEQVLKSK